MGQAKQRKTAAEALRSVAGLAHTPNIKKARQEGKKMLSHLISPHEIDLTMNALAGEVDLIVYSLPVTPDQGEGFITYAIEKALETIDMKSDAFTCLVVVNCRKGDKQKEEVETMLEPYTRSGFIRPLDLRSKLVNKDGSRKMSPTIPHHQTVISGEELVAHLQHLPKEAQQSDANIKFHRYHLRDHEEAFRFCAALCEKGGFGTVINKSVRIVAHWMRMAEMLLSDFETGPVELSECDAPYETPRVEIRVDGMNIQTENPRMRKGN